VLVDAIPHHSPEAITMTIDWTKFKPTTEWAIKLLEAGGNSSDESGRLYMETGPCKPWSSPVIAALRRRGYRVDELCRGVFLAHPKPSN
jgi:hypothetical protein